MQPSLHDLTDFSCYWEHQRSAHTISDVAHKRWVFIPLQLQLHLSMSTNTATILQHCKLFLMMFFLRVLCCSCDTISMGTRILRIPHIKTSLQVVKFVFASHWQNFPHCIPAYDFCQLLFQNTTSSPRYRKPTMLDLVAIARQRCSAEDTRTYSELGKRVWNPESNTKFPFSHHFHACYRTK